MLLSAYGKEAAPRGQNVLECENFRYVLPPYVRFANFEARKLNISYIKKEFLWYLKGDRFDSSIGQHAKMWQGLVNDDGSLNSNYGQYIFGEQNLFDKALETLTADKDSRRASIMILNNEHLFSNTKDVPCTYALNFRIRENSLHMTVHMRSQDAIFGMGNDAPAFSFIHEMMFHSLKEVYPELEYGEYLHHADSFHIYERHFEMLKKILTSDVYAAVECPRISGADEVRFLRKLQFESIPESYKFTQWLTNN